MSTEPDSTAPLNGRPFASEVREGLFAIFPTVLSDGITALDCHERGSSAGDTLDVFTTKRAPRRTRSTCCTPDST